MASTEIPSCWPVITDEVLAAYHQAGRVIAMCCRGLAFEHVTMERTEDELCHNSIVALKESVPENFDFTLSDEECEENSGIDRREVEAHITCMLAGNAATAILANNLQPPDPAPNDEGLWAVYRWSLRQSHGCDDPEFSEPREALSYLNFMWWRTVGLLRDSMPWSCVEKIANALLERKHLTYEDCVKLQEEGLEKHLEISQQRRNPTSDSN